MMTGEQLPAHELEDIKDYFHYQFERNRIDAETDVEVRKSALSQKLGLLGNASWFGGYDNEERVDIFVAGAGGCLEPLNKHTSRTTIWTRQGEVIGSEAGGRSFVWGATIFLGTYASATTSFMDAETGEIGLYEFGHESKYVFPEEQAFVLGTLENYLGNIFHPGSKPTIRPARLAERYMVLSRPE